MYIIELTLLFYFGYVSLYSFMLSFAGLFYKNKKAPEAKTLRKIAVLIPAYKEDQVIPGVAAEALKQNYPSEFFDVIIIADSLKSSTLEKLRALPITVVEVFFEKSTKVKALNHAMQVIGDDYDYALILDADNIMERDFIRKMNNLLDLGYRAIQGRRDPKNENTPMALLDGLSETINNFIYRQGNSSIGLSAPINGSGMIFDYAIYKEIMGSMDSIGGFDRELELKLLSRDIKVYYANDIVVYDEKVANHQVFEHQRKRWISSHFFYLKKYFSEGWAKLFEGNLSFFNSAVLRNVQLPRLLNLGSLTFITLLSFVFFAYLAVSPVLWMALLGLNILAMTFAVPRRFYNIRMFRSVLLIPGIFLKMLLLLFRLRGANTTFIHTPHGRVEMNVTEKK